MRKTHLELLPHVQEHGIRMFGQVLKGLLRRHVGKTTSHRLRQGPAIVAKGVGGTAASLDKENHHQKDCRQQPCPSGMHLCLRSTKSDTRKPLRLSEIYCWFLLRRRNPRSA